MLNIIAYIFKIVMSLVVGFLIGHDFKEKNDESIDFYSMIYCFITVSIIGVFNIKFNSNEGFVFGLIIVALIYSLSYVVNDISMENKFKLVFSIVNGAIIGVGFILYSFIAILVYLYIYQNSHIILKIFNPTTLDKKINKEDEL